MCAESTGNEKLEAAIMTDDLNKSSWQLQGQKAKKKHKKHLD